MKLLPIAVVLAGLAGCGGSGERAETTKTTRTIPPPEIRGTSPLIPGEAVGPAPEGAPRVIRSWAAAVRAADWDRAADQFRIGAEVQNGGPVERLRTRDHVVFWNASLPCGATVEEIGGAKGYAIVRFRLTEREGGRCGDGVGRSARAAIKVDAGHITGWYRLPGGGEAPAPESQLS